MTGPLRSGRLAAEVGVNPQTLRYYERRGLLPRPVRSPGGHRLYPAESVTRLRLIKAAQRLGFTLDEVAGLIDAGRHRHGRADISLHARAQDKLIEIETRIADLRTVADGLRDAIAAGCDDLTACAASPDCPLPLADPTRAPDHAG